jgi:oligopeptide/dipeptide ABC transporter ATP-binding protein
LCSGRGAFTRGGPVIAPLLVTRGLTKTFAKRRLFGGVASLTTPAVQDVTLTVGEGETLGVVGESGAGKTTLGRLLIRLVEPDSGSITFRGTDVCGLGQRALRRLRPQMQMVFQNPYSSLDPTMTVAESIGEPLKVQKGGSNRADRGSRVKHLLDRVGLPASAGERYPREFSGGQLQRLAIARALCLEPALVVLDEPVAALDLSVQGQILNLLLDLQQERGLAYVLISHDLGVVEGFADRVAVMYNGRILEFGSSAQVCTSPAHPYSQMLLASVPVADPRKRREQDVLVSGERQPAVRVQSGCSFAPRCPHAFERCHEITPPLVEVNGVSVACHLFSDAVTASATTRSPASH